MTGRSVDPATVSDIVQMVKVLLRRKALELRGNSGYQGFFAASSPKRSKQIEDSRMSSFVNPLDRHKSIDLPERAAAIKLWTRQNLPLTEETAVSVSEFACAKPSCPNRQTVILVLSEDMSTQKMSIHKALADVCEADVFDACLELLRNWPA